MFLVLVFEQATPSLSGYIYVYMFIYVHQYNNTAIIAYFVFPGSILVYENGIELKNLKKPALSSVNAKTNI
jgi:hypothetical protein